MSYVFVKNTTKIKISASQRISIKNCMNYYHNKNVGYVNFRRAIENYIWVARRAIVEKLLMRRLLVKT